MLVHVIDASNPDWPRQRASVEAILHELKLDGKPTVLAFNKVDARDRGGRAAAARRARGQRADGRRHRGAAGRDRRAARLAGVRL